MINTDTRTERSAPQQLTLLADVSDPKELAPSKAHTRFRLSTTTRERGLEHIAEIRAQLAEAQARRETSTLNPLPARSRQAA